MTTVYTERLVFLAEAKRRYDMSPRLQKLPRVEAAKELGVGKTSICRWGIAKGVPTPTYRYREEREKNEIAMLASKEFGLAGKQSIVSIPVLSKKFHMPYSAVFKIQKDMGVAPMGSSQRQNPPGESYRLTIRPEDLTMVQLAKEWHRPKGMTDHLETLDVHK